MDIALRQAMHVLNTVYNRPGSLVHIVDTTNCIHKQAILTVFLFVSWLVFWFMLLIVRSSLGDVGK